MSKGDAQCSVTSHRESGNPTGRSPGLHAVSAFNEGHEFMKKKIAVQCLGVAGINVERVPAVRCNHQKIARLMIAPQILQGCPLSGYRHRLFVSSQTMH